MKGLLIVFLSMMLYGCDIAPAPTPEGTARKLVESITYVKAKNGICFGVVFPLSGVFNSSDGGMVTVVNCEEVGL